STEASQLVYHEALMVPMIRTRSIVSASSIGGTMERVLIIGSSEGVASQLAIAYGAELVDHVDIDAETVRACAQHLPYGYTPEELTEAERGTGRVRVHYRDGWEFLTTTTTRYDVVV